MSHIEPSVHRTDFSCPHCQAHAAQHWSRLFAVRMSGEQRNPFFPKGKVEDVDFEGLNPEVLGTAQDWVRRLLAGEFFYERLDPSRYVDFALENVYTSECFNCKKLALWIGKRLVEPNVKLGASPNLDIDPEIRADIEEARSILALSPRGAAALLRLALQKLCVQLGESGKNIDGDIKNLVSKGLDPHLQRAFDIVRVIGNEAVHPGVIDLRDDVGTAAELINLINIVAQAMITNKKIINQLYERLPAGKLAGIEQRDKREA